MSSQALASLAALCVEAAIPCRLLDNALRLAESQHTCPPKNQNLVRHCCNRSDTLTTQAPNYDLIARTFASPTGNLTALRIKLQHLAHCLTLPRIPRQTLHTCPQQNRILARHWCNRSDTLTTQASDYDLVTFTLTSPPCLTAFRIKLQHFANSLALLWVSRRRYTLAIGKSLLASGALVPCLNNASIRYDLVTFTLTSPPCLTAFRIKLQHFANSLALLWVSRRRYTLAIGKSLLASGALVPCLNNASIRYDLVTFTLTSPPCLTAFRIKLQHFANSLALLWVSRRRYTLAIGKSLLASGALVPCLNNASIRYDLVTFTLTSPPCLTAFRIKLQHFANSLALLWVSRRRYTLAIGKSLLASGALVPP